MEAHEHEVLKGGRGQPLVVSRLRSLVLEALSKRLPSGAPVLDAGCGPGGMMRVFRDFDVHGIDEADVAVRHCKERGLTNTVVGTVHDLPFADASFDAVLSLDVLYHAGVDEDRALAEMRRVLRPGSSWSSTCRHSSACAVHMTLRSVAYGATGALMSGVS